MDYDDDDDDGDGSDYFSEDEDLPIISTTTNKLVNGKVSGKTDSHDEQIRSLSLSTTKGLETSSDELFKELIKIIEKIEPLPFPSPDNSAERSALVFLCKLIQTFQGAIVMKFCDMPTAFIQLHGEPMEYKRYVVGMKSLLKDLIAPSSEKWTKASSKFKDFISLLPWFSFFQHGQMFYILRTRESCVKKWALKQIDIFPFISALSHREGKASISLLGYLLSFLFTCWNNNKAEPFSELLLKQALELVYISNGENTNFPMKITPSVVYKNFPFYEEKRTSEQFPGFYKKNFDTANFIIVSPLPPLNKIGPCECSCCLKINIAPKNIIGETVIAPEITLLFHQNQNLADTTDWVSETNFPVNKVVFGSEKADRWLGVLHTPPTAERISLCYNRDYFHLKKIKSII